MMLLLLYLYSNSIEALEYHKTSFSNQPFQGLDQIQETRLYHKQGVQVLSLGGDMMEPYVVALP